MRGQGCGLSTIVRGITSAFKTRRGSTWTNFGKPIPPNVPLVNSKASEIGVPRDARKALTHFKNGD